MERVLLRRGGLPVLAFHLNQATSTNKALIINAFTESNTMRPFSPHPHSYLTAQTSHKINGTTLFDITIVVLNPTMTYYTCMWVFLRAFDRLCACIMTYYLVCNSKFYNDTKWNATFKPRLRMKWVWIYESSWIQRDSAEFSFLEHSSFTERKNGGWIWGSWSARWISSESSLLLHHLLMLLCLNSPVFFFMSYKLLFSINVSTLVSL